MDSPTRTGKPEIVAGARGNLAAWLGCLAATGCSLATEFEAPASAERTAELCEDHLDNDLDGLEDCADDECATFCSEDEAERCANGLDDDRDGFVDLEEPTCWAFADIEVERCSSRRSPPLQVEEAAFEEVSGRATVRDGAFVLETGDFIEFARDGGATWMLELELEPRGPLTAFVRSPTLGDETKVSQLPDRLEVAWGVTGSFDVTSLDGRTEPFALRLGVDAGRVDTAEVVDAATGQVAARADSIVGERVPAASASRTLRVELRNDGPGALLVHRVELDRAPFDPCGYPVPQFTDPEREVVAVAISPDLACLLQKDNRTFGAELLFAQTAPIDQLGAWSETRVELPTGVTTAALHWAADRARFEGLVSGNAGLRGEGTRLVVLTSPDCTDWTAEEAEWQDALLAALSRPLASPEVVAFEVDGVRRRALLRSFEDRLLEGSSTLIRLEGSDLGALRAAGSSTIELSSEAASGVRQPVQSAIIEGSDTPEGGPVFLAREVLAEQTANDGERLVLVEVRREGRAVRTVELLAPSFRSGEFDAELVDQPVLGLSPVRATPDERQGLLTYRGADGATGVVSIRATRF